MNCGPTVPLISNGETDIIGVTVRAASAVMPEFGEEEDVSCATIVYEPLATAGIVNDNPEGKLPDVVAVNVPRSVE